MVVFTGIFYAFVIILLIWCTFYNWKRRHLYILSYKLNGPISYPIVGNVLSIIRNSPEEMFSRILQLLKLYNLNSRFWIGSQLFIPLKNVNDVQKVLSSQKLTEKMDVYKFMKGSFGNGLLASSGKIHRVSSRLIAPTLHPKVIESYIQIFQHHSVQFIENLRENVGKDFDIFSEVNLSTIKIVVETVLDVKVNPDITEELLRALIRMNDIFQERILKPWLHSDFIFNITSLGREQKELSKHFRGFIREVKKAKQYELLMNPSDTEYSSNLKQNSTLDFLLRKINQNPQIMNEDQLIDEISTLFLASQDTTSTQFSMAVLMLGMHPTIQDKVYKEIQDVLGSTTVYSASDLDNLKYLEMVMNECLRFLPVAPFFGRRVTENFQLENYVVPVDSCVLISLYEIHHDPEHWEKPDEFYPEHFTPEQISKRHPYAFIPFSSGPRRCLGKQYAFFLMKTMLITTLRNYKIKAKGTIRDLKVSGNIACRVVNGYPVCLTNRSSNCSFIR